MSIKKIFPDEFISGAITTKKDLDDAFLKYPNFSKTYIQTALYWKDTRKWYEDRWNQVYKYLDKNFLTEFQRESEHFARAWEFHLAAAFLEKGLKLVEKTWKVGPDFCIQTPSGKKIWIEAIACEDGEIPVKPYLLGTNQYSIEDMQHNRVLRVTSAFWTKFKKFNEYLKNPKIGMTNEDCLIIAINGSNIQGYSDAQALFERAMFGRGLDVYFKKPGRYKLQMAYKPAPPVKRTKKSDNLIEEIKTEPMTMEQFSKISAVLYSGYSIGHSSFSGIGDEFLFAYHTNPDNPIPKNLFKFGRGIRKDAVSGLISDQEQK